MTFRAKAKMASLTEADHIALKTAANDGFIVAEVYANGRFSKTGFEQYVRLQSLCHQGLLECTDGLCGKELLSGSHPASPAPVHANVWCTYVLTERGEALAGPADARRAA